MAEPVETVEVHQTHISVVFLAGSFAYKIKKPVDLGFIDYSTLERRRHFCEEEVRLNRRLAAEVYLGVVPMTREGGVDPDRGHRRGGRMGGQDEAAAGYGDAPRPAWAAACCRAAGGTGLPARSIPR